MVGEIDLIIVPTSSQHLVSIIPVDFPGIVLPCCFQESPDTEIPNIPLFTMWNVKQVMLTPLYSARMTLNIRSQECNNCTDTCLGVYKSTTELYNYYNDVIIVSIWHVFEQCVGVICM